MAISQVVGTRRDGKVTLKDSAANTLLLVFEAGDFSFSEPKADRVVIRDRGAISGLRKGDDPVGECAFSVHFSEFTNATATVLMDVCYHRGNASTFVSVGGAGYEQFLVDIEFEADKITLGDSHVAKATLAKVLLTASFSESESDTLEITGEVYGGITYAGIV